MPASDYTLDTLKFLSLYLQNIDRNRAKRAAEAEKKLSQLRKENERRTKTGMSLLEPAKELFEDNYELYDYDVLWAVATSDSGPDLGLRNAAIDCLIEAISKWPKVLENYLSKTVNFITSGNELSFLPSMEFLRRAIVRNDKKLPARDTLLYLNKEYQLFDHVFRHFNRYKSEVYAALSQPNVVRDVMSHVSLLNEIYRE
ncbi:MAG: hypothetical protein P4M11_06875 [Candidatus Pacebacteria bacterium]|nr:hypothetical protein [Candidatus Paceibacterota bacterium]